MKLLDALINVDKSDGNTTEVYCDEIFEVADVSEYDIDLSKFEKGLKGYWLYRHMCTDTMVGIMAIYLNGELVGYTEQQARKSATYLYFISGIAANKTIDFVKSCVLVPEEIRYRIMSNVEIEDFQSVYYTGQLVEKVGYVDGKKAIAQFKRLVNIIDKQLDVMYEDGSIETINCSDFKFPIHVANKE